MNKLKRIVCLALAALMVVALVACGGDGSTASSGSNSNGNGTSEHRPHYDDGETDEVVVFEDNDHLFDYELVEWDGPKGYVIVVPAGNAEAKTSAQYLQKYYKDAFEIELSITTGVKKAIRILLKQI